MNAPTAKPLTIHSTRFERATAAVGAARVLVRDPNRLDQVLVFLQAVNLGTLRRRLGEFDRNPAAQELLRDQPRIDRQTVDFDALAQQEDATLGREYVRFLRSNGISPEPFETLPAVGDDRAAYLLLRLRQTHDLWHVVTGYAPDVEGELLLQAFTFAQTGSPGSAMIALLGSLRYALRKPGHVRNLWKAYQRGKAAKLFATFRWENYFSAKVSEVQQELNCAPLPANS